MDRWKYFSITHKFHTLMNPMSEQKVDELIRLLGVFPESHIIDIGCGKGEFLLRIAEKVQINGIGVDLSPYVIKEAKIRSNERLPDAQIKFVESEGKAYLETVKDQFDISSCMGASWIFGNHENTLKALINVTRKHGMIIVGEPFWIKQPTQWYLEMAEVSYNDFGSHAQNIEVGEKLGLRPIYALTSNLDEWDRYEKLQWLGVDNYVMDNPEDSDNDELLAKVSNFRNAYIKEGRDVFGWGLYVFRKLD